MTEPEIVYRFTPQFDGAFLQGVPKRDLTQKDVDRLTGAQRADAFTPHPGTGKTMYTAVKPEPKSETKADKKGGDA
jgi:hypothetical protein